MSGGAQFHRVFFHTSPDCTLDPNFTTDMGKISERAEQDLRKLMTQQ